MKMYIPRLKDVVKLTRPWSFILHCEYRNKSVWELNGIPYVYWERDLTSAEIKKHNVIVTPHTNVYDKYSVVMELPVGTQLSIDRIYIRKGGEEFDSVTFNIVKGTMPNFKSGKARFWAKLDDVNTMEFEPV